MIVVQGIRSGDNFLPKKYASSTGEQLYKITDINSNGDIKLDRMVPGDRVEFKVQINNLSNVDVAYKVYAVVDGELVESLEFTQLATKEYSSWKSLPYTGVEAVETINCVVELPESVGNEYQEKTANIKIVVEAVQGNAVSTFDGAEPTDPVAALAEVT